MAIDDKEYKYNIFKILHKSREDKLTFLSDRQFKTTILAVTVDLIVADRLYGRPMELTNAVKIILTISLSLFNLLVLNYIISKHLSYKSSRNEYKSHERTLYGLADMELIPYPKKNKLYQWISDGTKMFGMMIVFAWVLTIIVLWGQTLAASNKDIKTNVPKDNVVPRIEQKCTK